MDAMTVTVDLAKDVFEVAVANRTHRIVERRRLTRRQFDAFIEGLVPGTTVVMEACGTAHYWGRRCQSRGVAAVLLPTQYVRPYVRRNKTDRTDAEALLEAHRCAGIHAVPVKSREQQALQALHRVRTQWQTARTARINVIRGLLREHGHPVAVGARTVLTRVRARLDDATLGLPAILHQTVAAIGGPRRLDRSGTRPRGSRGDRRSPALSGARRWRRHRHCVGGRRATHPRVPSRTRVRELAGADAEGVDLGGTSAPREGSANVETCTSAVS